MAESEREPWCNAYARLVRVEGEGVWLHEELWQLLEEVAGHRPAIATAAQLLRWLERQAARLAAEHDPKATAVARVHRAELLTLRDAVLAAMGQAAAPDTRSELSQGRLPKHLH